MKRLAVTAVAVAGVVLAGISVPAEAASKGRVCNTDDQDYVIAADFHKRAPTGHDTLWPGQCTGDSFDADAVYPPPNRVVLGRVPGPDRCDPAALIIYSGTRSVYVRRFC